MDDDDAEYMQGSEDEVLYFVSFANPSGLHGCCVRTQVVLTLYQRKRQDYGFDYSDNDEANESGSADVENMYYTAKCVFQPSPLFSTFTQPAVFLLDVLKNSQERGRP